MFGDPWLRLTNNWLHDFSSGLWGSAVAVIWLLHGRLGGVPADAAAVLVDAQRLMWWVLLASLAVITLTGAVRLTYWRSVTPAEQMPAKRPALIGKHVAFLGIYGLGTWWAWSLLG